MFWLNQINDMVRRAFLISATQKRFEFWTAEISWCSWWNYKLNTKNCHMFHHFSIQCLSFFLLQSPFFPPFPSFFPRPPGRGASAAWSTRAARCRCVRRCPTRSGRSSARRTRTMPRGAARGDTTVGLGWRHKGLSENPLEYGDNALEHGDNPLSDTHK